MEFKKYRRTAISEMREVTKEEIEAGYAVLMESRISISKSDIEKGSPKQGDMIARNPKDHDDLWLVSKEYFEDNFEKIT